MIFGEEDTAPLFFIYLWVTFGCGFRFGANYLLISLALSTVGFITVLSVSDYWARNTTLGIGLLLGMILLSLYVLTLVKRLYEARSNARKRQTRRNEGSSRRCRMSCARR